MKTFDTSDYHLAITLITLGFLLVEVDKSDVRRAVFRFEHQSDIEESAKAFFDDKLTLNPRLVMANSRLLKERLRS